MVPRRIADMPKDNNISRLWKYWASMMTRRLMNCFLCGSVGSVLVAWFGVYCWTYPLALYYTV
jgi:hypothetical protein